MDPPPCPEGPHAHTFKMPCHECKAEMEVADICSPAQWTDEDSPDYDPDFDAKALAWLRSTGYDAAPSKTSGDPGIACRKCGALSGAFFIGQEFIEIVHLPDSYATVEMPWPVPNQEVGKMK